MTKNKPLLMGILNATPDSFFDKGAYFSIDAALQRALEICADGADLLDVGGESSRPGSIPVSDEEELRRGIPLIEALFEKISVPSSIGQFKSFGLRVLIGASRKSFMTKIWGKPPKELLPATLAIHTMSMLSGANLIRVHDIKEH